MITLYLHADERPPTIDKPAGCVHIGVAHMPTAYVTLRTIWSDHRDIACLPSLRIVPCEGVTDDQVDKIQRRLAGYLHDLGNSSEDSWWGTRNAIRNSVDCVTGRKHDSLIGAAAGRPVVCVASGPSVADYIGDICYAARRGAVIVCADSIYRTLVSAGINPDFVCVIERQAVFAELVPPDICQHTRLVCPPVVDRSTVAGWGDRVVWFWQTVSDLYGWLSPEVPMAYSGRSAGTLAVAVSQLLGGSEIHLVGHDLCRIGGASHASTVGDLTRVGQAKAEASADESGMFARVSVDCRDGVARPSTRFWCLCRDDIESMLANTHGPTYAVGFEGAHINGAITRADLVPHVARKSPLVLRPATPGRYLSHLVPTMLDDIARCLGLCEATPSDLGYAECIAAAHGLEPKAWAHADTERMFWHVLSTIYHASSLRAHLRSTAPEWPRLALGILTRGLPPILRAMEHDLREMRQ